MHIQLDGGLSYDLPFQRSVSAATTDAGMGRYELAVDCGELGAAEAELAATAGGGLELRVEEPITRGVNLTIVLQLEPVSD